MRIALITILIPIFIFNCAQVGLQSIEEATLIDLEVSMISDSLLNQIPQGSNILILDFKDLNNVITHFGKYMAGRISGNLSLRGGIKTIDRNNIELILNEQRFQNSGIVDEKTASELGKIVGATHIVFGAIAEFHDFVGLDLKVVDVEKGIVIGGIAPKIKKSEDVLLLVSTIVKSEEQQQKELSAKREAILKEVENERQRRLRALEVEEQKKKRQLVSIEDEIRSKSIIIAEYESRRAELLKQQSYIQQIHAEIDKMNRDVLSKLKLGMTKNQINDVLGYMDATGGNVYMAGQYFLVFEGNILTKVVPLGQEWGIYGPVETWANAKSTGKNVAKR